MIAPARHLTFALVLVGAVAGCSSSSGAGPTVPPSPPTSSLTRATSPAPSTGAPISTGPTTAAHATSCPLVKRSFVQDTVGMRLAKITVLHSAGAVIGCRFYALQNSALHDSERLPGPNQPAVEIVTQRFRSAVDAHNAFVRTAESGRNPQQEDLGRGVTGLCFQVDFYAKDHGSDWACAANLGSKTLLVRTVVTSPALDAATVTRRVLGAL